jgi:hypothetical protein
MGIYTPPPPFDPKLPLCGGLLRKLVSLGLDLHALFFWTRKLPHLLTDGVIPVRDEAQLHTAHRTSNLLQDVGKETMGYLPFCPDFTLSDFCVSHLEGTLIRTSTHQ